MESQVYLTRQKSGFRYKYACSQLLLVLTKSLLTDPASIYLGIITVYVAC